VIHIYRVKVVLKHVTGNGQHYYRVVKISGLVVLNLPSVDGQPAVELRLGSPITENMAVVLASCYPVEVV